MSDSTQPQSAGEYLAELFRPMPLPRGRAILTLIFGSFGFLAFAGTLSYSAGSPDTYGQPAAAYWAVLFGVYFLVLLGATLLGGFPRLARWTFKLIWLSGVGVATVTGLLVWNHLRPAEAPLFPGGWAYYLPALIVTMTALLFPPLDDDWEKSATLGTNNG